jgi:hypothetical protein
MDSTDRGSTGTGRGGLDRLTTVEVQQEQLAETVRGLAATVRRVAGTGPAGPGRAPGAGPVEGGELVEWVSWLVGRYELDIVPCWPRHGALVEELDALRIGWHDTIGKGQGGLAAMQWHDGLVRVVERIDNRWAKACIDGSHRVQDPPGWVEGGPEGAEEINLVGGRYRPAEGAGGSD